MTQWAVVFPGQGSQSLGMLADIAGQYSEVQSIFNEASTVLDYDLWQLVQQGPKEKLDQTQYTQPALLAASYALWCIIQARYPLSCQWLAGHSLGEYTALVAARALSFSDAIRLVAMRGAYMQAAITTGEGAMAAIVGLSDEEVLALCAALRTSPDDVLAPANFNSIGQVVISGHRHLIQEAIALAKEKGAKLATLIPVSVPSHCALMQPAAEQFALYLNNIELRTPQVAVISNVDVQPYRDVESIRDGLVRQLYSPVRWVETIQFFAQQGVTHLLECGPGKVLTGLNKRIDKSFQLSVTADLDNLNSLLTEQH